MLKKILPFFLFFLMEIGFLQNCLAPAYAKIEILIMHSKHDTKDARKLKMKKQCVIIDLWRSKIMLFENIEDCIKAINTLAQSKNDFNIIYSGSQYKIENKDLEINIISNRFISIKHYVGNDLGIQKEWAKYRNTNKIYYKEWARTYLFDYKLIEQIGEPKKRLFNSLDEFINTLKEIVKINSNIFITVENNNTYELVNNDIDIKKTSEDSVIIKYNARMEKDLDKSLEIIHSKEYERENILFYFVVQSTVTINYKQIIELEGLNLINKEIER